MRAIAFLLILFALLSLAPWFVMAPAMLLAFGAGATPHAWAMLAGLAAYPLWLLGWLWGMWHRLRRDDDGTAVVYGILALLPAIFVAALLFASLAPRDLP